jgi:hypothetical protein
MQVKSRPSRSSISRPISTPSRGDNKGGPTRHPGTRESGSLSASIPAFSKTVPSLFRKQSIVPCVAVDHIPLSLARRVFFFSSSTSAIIALRAFYTRNVSAISHVFSAELFGGLKTTGITSPAAFQCLDLGEEGNTGCVYSECFQNAYCKGDTE